MIASDDMGATCPNGAVHRAGDGTPRRTGWIPRLGRACVLGAALCATTVTGAEAATKEFKIPKAAAIAGINAYASGISGQLDNWGKLRNKGKNSVTWHADNSFIRLPNGSKPAISIPRSPTVKIGNRRYNAYIDDMRVQKVDVQADGKLLLLRVFFEAAGNELRVGCIKRSSDKPCRTHVLKHTGDIDNAFLYIWFKPSFNGAKIRLIPTKVDFDYDFSLDSKLLNTVTKKFFADLKGKLRSFTNDRIVPHFQQSAVAQTLAVDLNQALTGKMASFFRDRLGADNVGAWINGNVSIQTVRDTGTSYAITVKYPDIVGPKSVRILDFKPKSANLTAGCPLNFGFNAAIKTNTKVAGTVWMEYENGKKSAKQSWKMAKAGTAKSTMVRKIKGQAGKSKKGWARMVVQYKDSLGRKHTKKSGKAKFKATCSSAVGSLQSN